MAMKLPELLANPELWTGWFWLGDDIELGDTTVEISSGDEQLVLELAAADLGIARDGVWFRVGLDLGGSYRSESQALRWREVELLGRTVALRGGPPHLGVMMPLFGRFAPICAADRERVPAIEAAFLAAGVTRDQLRGALHQIDWRDSDLRWVRDAHGWLLEGKYATTARRSSSIHDERDEDALWRDDSPVGWIERTQLRTRIDQFFARLAAECVATVEPWRTPHVLELVADAGDPAVARVLADALHEAGCDNQAILRQLAERPDQAGWLVELLRSSTTWGE